MGYDQLLGEIYEALPHLRDQLSSPQVVYVEAQKKAYITFRSGVLVEEASFLKMEAILRRIFMGRALALRVVSPALKDDFLTNIGQYKQVLSDFLKRNYPASASWMDAIDWRSSSNRITLTFPDEFSMHYMARQNVSARLSQAVKDIFNAEATVELAVSGDQEARLAALRQERAQETTHAYTARELQDMTAAKAAEAAKAAAARPGKPKTEGGMSSEKDGRAILGRAIGDKPVEMKELTSDTGTVTVQGDIFKKEVKELKGGELLLVTFAVTDYTSSILCKTFMRFRKGGRRGEETPTTPITEEERKAVMDKVDQIKEGMNVKVRGECLYDSFARELSISVRDLQPMVKVERTDTAEEKRVELHMHTNMSANDGMASAGDLIARAAKWGHPAVAITDHGVLQSFPAAFKAAKSNKIKLLPGCEGYLIDHDAIVRNPSDRTFNEPIVVLDFESTGLNTANARVIEIGAVKLIGDTVADSLMVMVNPKEPVPQAVQELTGITDMMLADKDTAEKAIPQLMEFIGDCPLAAHNASFDIALLKAELARLGQTWNGMVVDTLTFARKLYPDMKSHKLKNVCKQLGVSLKNAHRAVHDATATAQCLAKMFRQCEEMGVTSYEQLNTDERLLEGAIGKSHHIILLARTQEGMVNLNRLVSISHLEYFRRQPHMPRKVIQQYREGLILGSACEAGELFRAVLQGESHERLL